MKVNFASLLHLLDILVLAAILVNCFQYVEAQDSVIAKEQTFFESKRITGDIGDPSSVTSADSFQLSRLASEKSNGKFVESAVITAEKNGQYEANPSSTLKPVSHSAGAGDGLRWDFNFSVLEGIQFAADAGPNNRIHLIGSEYCQIDLDGKKVLSEAVSDEGQKYMSFPPAISVSKDSSVHVVTRHGEGYSDLTLRYRYRNPDGLWTRDYVFGSKTKRNYVVGVAASEVGGVTLMHTVGGENVWGEISLFEGLEYRAKELGSIKGIWRSDNDSRIRSFGDTVYLIAGRNDPDGTASYSWGASGSTLVGDINANMKTHRGGEGRRGFPDLAIDEAGVSHLCYGAFETVMYNQYTKDGEKVFEEDIEIFSDLGQWHLSTGLSDIEVSADGRYVMVVALKTNGTSEKAWNSKILYTYSEDGGRTWKSQGFTGVKTHGGEGRARPVLCSVDNRFLLLYNDIVHGGISVGVAHF